MLVRVRVGLRDGREFDLAQELEDGVEWSAAEVVARATYDGHVALSDTASVPAEEIAHATLLPLDAPEGPGWGPGLQDEDAASASDGRYSPDR